MALPDFRINPYVQPYQGGLSQDFAPILGQRIQDYDITREESDVLSYQNDALKNMIAPFEGDAAIAGQIMNDTRREIQSMADRGDYENLGRAVRQSARNFKAKAEPLLENKERLNTYLKNLDEQFKAGKIGVDTLNKAKAFSTMNYKGLDPTNIRGSMFSGFDPSADVNIADKVDKAVAGWKASGGSRPILNPDGVSYTQKTWEQANENDIRQFAKDYLRGDSEFGSYAQTQETIGNAGRLKFEYDNSIEGAVNKYGYTKSGDELHILPEWLVKAKKEEEGFRNALPAPLSAHGNPRAVTLGERGVTIDEATGKPIPSSLVTREADGSYWIYKDRDGKQITPLEYEKIVGRGSTGLGHEGPRIEVGATKERVTPEQAAAMGNAGKIDQDIENIALSKFLSDKRKAGVLPAGVLDNEELLKEYLRVHEKEYKNPQYRTQAAKEFEESTTNAKVMYSNKKFPVSRVASGATPEATALETDDVIATLTGRSIGVMDPDPKIGGYRDGEKSDINSMIQQLQGDGFHLEKAALQGPTYFNAYSDPSTNEPGMSYVLQFRDKDKNLKTVEVVASIQDDDLQPVQDVYAQAASGLSGTVPFYAPNAPGGGVQGQFRLLMSSDVDRDGKRKPSGSVEILNAEGHRVPGKSWPEGLQDIPIDKFGEIYERVYAPNLRMKYRKPK